MRKTATIKQAGERIKKIREHKDWTIKKLAKRSKVEEPTIRLIEQGKIVRTTSFHIEQIVLLCDTLNAPYYLIFDPPRNAGEVRDLAFKIKTREDIIEFFKDLRTYDSIPNPLGLVLFHMIAVLVDEDHANLIPKKWYGEYPLIRKNYRKAEKENDR